MSANDAAKVTVGRGEGKFYALAMGIGALASVALMTHHPTGHGADFPSFVRALAEIAPLSSIVHGGMLAALGAIAFGFQGALLCLVPSRPLLRGAWLAFASGTLAYGGAAVTNGFIVGRLATRYAREADEVIESARPLFRLCHAANQSMAELGAVASAVGIACASIALLRRGTIGHLLGGAGLLLAFATLLGLGNGLLELDLHGMGAVVLGQALWFLALAAQLRRLSPPLHR